MTLFYGIKEIRADKRRCENQMDDPNAIFVFGSNELGIHRSGAAKAAIEDYGAVFGQGYGHQGRCFALPTKSTPWVSLPLERVGEYVRNFLASAALNPELTYVVTRIGCGLAGFTDTDIAPLFKEVPDNVKLPEGWWEYANR